MYYALNTKTFLNRLSQKGYNKNKQQQQRKQQNITNTSNIIASCRDYLQCYCYTIKEIENSFS